MQGRIKNHINLLPLLILLASCGGGSSRDLPSSPALDKDSPLILSISPGFEQTGIDPNKFIRVTFNETLNNTITTEQVSVYSVVNGTISENIITDKSLFSLNTKNIKNDELVIALKPNDLSFNTRYRVSIQNIKDTSGNSMVDLCQWDFVTKSDNGTPNKQIDFAVTHIGSCKKNDGPKQPQHIQAFVSNNQFNGQRDVVVSWKAPVSGNDTEHYQIEKAVLPDINSQAIYKIIKNVNVIDLAFVDTNITIGPFYRYRITTHNNNGSSLVNLSNFVNTQIDVPIIKPKDVLSPNKLPMPGLNYGKSIALNNDNSILAVGSSTSGGYVHIYSKMIDRWKYETSLLDHAYSGQFGSSMAFSSDDILAVGQPRYGNIGAVQLYSRTVDGWRNSATLYSNSPLENNEFGKKLVFSPDGNTLAIGEASNTVVTVQLFTKTIQGTWIYSETLEPNTTSFGYELYLAFNTNKERTLLAVASGNTIQLFRKTSFNWSYITELPGIKNGFAFSPDGKTIASAEQTPESVGLILLFNEISRNTWKLDSESPSTKLTNSSRFGENIKFSQDGTVLAVADPNGVGMYSILTGTVQLFLKTTTNNWNLIATLSTNNPSNGFFGSSMSFNPSDSTLIIGERRGSIDRNTTMYGVVNIFDLNNLVNK